MSKGTNPEEDALQDHYPPADAARAGDKPDIPGLVASAISAFRAVRAKRFHREPPRRIWHPSLGEVIVSGDIWEEFFQWISFLHPLNGIGDDPVSRLRFFRQTFTTAAPCTSNRKGWHPKHSRKRWKFSKFLYSAEARIYFAVNGPPEDGMFPTIATVFPRCDNNED